MVYPVGPDSWYLDDLPPGAVTTVLGVDLGAAGTSAIAVVSIVSGDRRVFVRQVSTRQGLSVSQLAGWVEQTRQEWSAGRVIVDAGGLGGAYIEELRQRYGIAALAAEKSAKSAAIESLVSDLRGGVLVVDPRRCRPWLDEASVLVWDSERLSASGARIYSDRMPDHACDAVLYAWRAVRPREVRQLDLTEAEKTRQWQAEDLRRELDAIAREARRGR